MATGAGAAAACGGLSPAGGLKPYAVRPARGKALSRLVLLVALAATATAAQAALPADWQTSAARVVEWATRHHAWALLALALADAIAVLLLLPAFLVAACAGFLFGVLWGSLLMVSSSVLGASVAFALGQRWLRTRALSWLTRWPRLAALAGALRAGGWRAVMLLRFVPFVPFKSGNYLLGALDIRAPAFVFGTALGIVPMTVVTVAAGALAEDVLNAHGAYHARGVDALLLLLALAAACVLGWRARGVLRAGEAVARP